MPNVRVLKSSFSGGEISRELFGRLDISKVQAGLDTCRNFIIMPHGVASNRPGFQYVNEVKTSANFTRLMQFSFSSSQTFAIEMGAGYFRYHSQGSSLLAGSLSAYSSATATVTSNISTATVTMTIAAPAVVTWTAHGLAANKAITFSTTGALPTGLTAGTLYYVLAPTTDTFTVSATAGGAAITTSGTQSGVHSCAAPGIITWTAHTLTTDSAISFTTTGALPTGLMAGVTYYVRNPTTNTFELSAKRYDIASLSTSGTQSGVHTGNRCYVQGDLVSSAGTNYYCIAATMIAHAPPNATYWYAMPSDGLYELPNPYAQADLATIKYVQSGDVITIVHPNYPPAELKRYANTNWTLTAIPFASQTIAPTGVAVVATHPTVGVVQDFKYQITALNSLGYEESPASTVSNTVSNDLTITGNYNTITWSAVTGSIRYNVYKYASGTYAYIGQTSGLSLKDDNILADLTKTLPITDTIFASANNYPSSVCYYQQRRFFAGTINQPQNIWSTQSSSDYNIAYSIPSQGSDALRFKIAAQKANAIRHLMPNQSDLLVLTASTEWSVSADSGSALTAATLNIKTQTQNGTSTVAPVFVNKYILYPQAQGGHIGEMSYSWQSSGYVSNDLCLLAPHLFDTTTISDFILSRAPVPVIWVINSAGSLLGLTYVPEQQVSAWHKHDTTNGLFESCVTTSENNADVLYVIVKRTINNVTKRYIEMLHTRFFTDPEDAFFVDCGLTYSGVSTTAISGLGHLEGQTVAILGDGAVMPQQVVTGGAITLPFAVTKAQIGLPITADLTTTPVAITGDATLGQSRIKNINKIWVRVYNSGGFSAGPDTAHLTPVKTRHYETPGTAPDLITDEIPLFVTSQFNPSGRVTIRQSDPLPLTIVDITTEVAVGG